MVFESIANVFLGAKSRVTQPLRRMRSKL